MTASLLPVLPLSAGATGLVGSAPIDAVLLLASFGFLLIGAEIFTNGVEWLGHRFGVSESATGSILAAVGTALPETMIPTIAIVGAYLGVTEQSAANEVGVGAILGAPFMLATIAMFLVGLSVLVFRNRRSYGADFHFNAESTRRDLSFFLVGYTLAFAAALIRSEIAGYVIGVTLVCLYVFYVYRSLQSGELIEDEGLDELQLGKIVDRVANDDETSPDGGQAEGHARDPGKGLVILQTLFALAIIIGGAHLFVTEVKWASGVVGIPTAVVALLLAPLATELPEKFNSVIWISEDKDTLAIGNITGAMAFQGTVPVTLGILFTSWNLALEWGTTGFLNGFSALLAILSGGVLYLRTRNAGEDAMKPGPFMLGGLVYVLFILVLVYHVVAYDLSVAGGH